MAEGYLEILGATAPESAHVGDPGVLTVHTQNTESADDFKVELLGGLIGSSEFYLGAGLIKDIPFSFTMPDQDVSITINTYHYEPEVGWVWDTTSVWELLFPFMNIKDRPFKQ